MGRQRTSVNRDGQHIFPVEEAEQVDCGKSLPVVREPDAILTCFPDVERARVGRLESPHSFGNHPIELIFVSKARESGKNGEVDGDIRLQVAETS